MLKALTIRNLAVIDTLDLEWRPGFTVLTGETGAGKSILIDAIGLAIGTRADQGLVRDGADRAEVSAEFELEPDAAALSWLRENALDDPDHPTTAVIRRVVQGGGRGRAFVNGTPVTTAQLRVLGESLIEIFGQAESQTLLRGETQRELLDAFGQHTKLLAAVAETATAVRAAERALDALRESAGRDPSQIEFLRFQVRELEALALADNEIETLDTEHRRLAGAGRLLTDGGSAQELLYGGDDSVYDRLSAARTLLEGLQSLSEDFAAPLEAVTSAQVTVQDAADSIRDSLERLELDPQRLNRLEQRLQAIHDLARKHRVRPEALADHQLRLSEQLEAVEHAGERMQELERALEQATARYRKAADALSAARLRAAPRFAEAVTGVVRTLGMPNASLVCSIESLNPEEPPARVRSHGQDAVRFDFSANPGQQPRPLAKVASGGELSRVSLAIQVIGQSRRSVPTMIFDEVDAGISGAVAEVVGQQLRRLGHERQVLSVTHLAQVAAQGHQHCAIRKTVRDGQTFTEVTPLDSRARVDELARMQGGTDVSAAARAHARDLLKRAAS